MKGITRTVWVLSLISLFTDMASEMLYPVMPVYLRAIGFSALLIGVLEGLAEATAGLSKAYFGKLSDERGKRAPFVQLGYALSAVAKPLLAVSMQPIWVFLCARPTDWARAYVRVHAMPCCRMKPGLRTKDRFSAFTGPWIRWVRYLARCWHLCGCSTIRATIKSFSSLHSCPA